MTHQFDNVGSEGTAAPSHTPGPWNYDGGDGREITAPSTHINTYGHACAQLVAVATLQADLNDGADDMPERSEDEAKANARLIAAAPDLLAALERLTADEPIEHDSENGSACFYCGKEWSRTRAHLGQVALMHGADCHWVQARAAIARAKGK